MPQPFDLTAAGVWLDGEAPTTLAAAVAELRQRLPQLDGLQQPVAFVCKQAKFQLAAAAWLASTGGDGLIVAPALAGANLVPRLLAEGLLLLDEDGVVAAPELPGVWRPGRIRLLTSGTTGEPKIVSHTWQSLFTMDRLREAIPRRWLVTFLPGSYAWFQVVCLALFVPGQSLCASASNDPAVLVTAAMEQGVDAVSATPTFWRNALLRLATDRLATWPLAHLSLGGEKVDQAILNRLRALFPRATLVHIYAATEVGAAMVVKDGLEGFPASWLTPVGPNSADAQWAVPADHPALRLKDGLLQVQSPYAGSGQAGWLDTGDRVEVRGDRAFLLGRAGGAVINVGGAKVLASDVERALLTQSDVLWCRVYGRRSPLTGELVCADVVRQPDSALTERTLLQAVAPALADYAVPRLVRFLPAIPTSANQKTELAAP